MQTEFCLQYMAAQISMVSTVSCKPKQM